MTEQITDSSKIEITPEMIEAGANILVESIWFTGQDSIAREVVKELFVKVQTLR